MPTLWTAWDWGGGGGGWESIKAAWHFLFLFES